MAEDYDWRDFEAEGWRGRYPGWVRGLEAWAGWRPPREWPPGERRLIPELPRVQPPHLRVFISHRRIDDALARTVAGIARRLKFPFWLDVLDPQLSYLTRPLGSSPTTVQAAAMMAFIIEMALINCSHVLIGWTQNTAGSTWVPYEYGRVKDAPPATLQAACWVAQSTTPAVLPEYLYLGPILPAPEAAVEQWLQAEKQRWDAGVRGGPTGGTR